MTVVKRAVPPHASRGVGQRAGLDLEQILAAARSLPPQSLTMQAVADRLGVDRKALNHHVRDRDSLLELVAREAFGANFAAVGLSETASWQDACRAYATAYSESLISIGALANSFRPGSSLLAGIILPTEVLLEKLLDAGFEEEKAAQCLTMLTFISIGFARNAALTREAGEHLGLAQLRRALAESPTTNFEALAHMADPAIDTSGRGLFDVSIEVFLRGCEALLLSQTALGGDAGAQRPPTDFQGR